MGRDLITVTPHHDAGTPSQAICKTPTQNPPSYNFSIFLWETFLCVIKWLTLLAEFKKPPCVGHESISGGHLNEDQGNSDLFLDLQEILSDCVMLTPHNMVEGLVNTVRTKNQGNLIARYCHLSL